MLQISQINNIRTKKNCMLLSNQSFFCSFSSDLESNLWKSELVCSPILRILFLFICVILTGMVVLESIFKNTNE